MNIRNFGLNDKEDFLSMCNEFYNSGASLYPIPIKQMEDTFTQIINDNPYVKGFIFEEKDGLAGYALVWIYWSNEAGGYVAFLDEIFVKSEYRGHSIG
ncbi:MAG: GNAT family N-acetyltransferase, partial [Oscillospiraceae bacterium]